MIVFYTTLLVSVTSYRFLPTESPHISGTDVRKFVSSAADSPYHVLIVYSSLYCSGALVRSKVVVTVASCMTVREPKNAVVKIGSDTIVGYGQIIPVIEVIIHEYFKHLSSMDNDIAVLALKGIVGRLIETKLLTENELDSSQVDQLPEGSLSIVILFDNLKHDVSLGPTAKKVIIVEPEVALRIGTTLEVTGWGGPNLQAKYTNVLLRSDMVVLNKTHCEKHYRHLITSSNFCVKYQPERRLSDNGGPAILKDLLVGLVSFGATNKKEPYVAVLTNVSYFHRKRNKENRMMVIRNKESVESPRQLFDLVSTFVMHEELNLINLESSENTENITAIHRAYISPPSTLGDKPPIRCQREHFS